MPHCIDAKDFTMNSFCTLLLHLSSCSCLSCTLLITHQSRLMLLIANAGTSAGSGEDIGGPQEIINDNE